MKIDRAELDAALKLIQPALFTKDAVAELGCFWLDGETIRAYDGEIGASVPLKSDALGGVKGAPFSAWVGSTSGPTIELTAGAESIVAKCGRSRVTFGMLPLDRRPKWPDKLTTDRPIPLGRGLLEALKLGMVAVSKTDSRPDFMGTTILPSQEDLDLYTCDGPTATWLICDRPDGWPSHRLAWPRRFCEQLVRSFSPDDELHLSKGTALVLSKNGTRLLGRELEIPMPADYPKMLDRMLPKDYGKQLYEIPEELKAALKRMRIVATKSESIKLEVAENKKLYLSAVSGVGESVDEIDLGGKQAQLIVKVEPSLLARALDYADRMLITDNCIVVESSKTGFLNLVSATSI